MRKILLGTIVLLAACKGDGTGPVIPSTTAVSALISTNTTTLTIGSTAQLTATGYNTQGKAVSATFTWASDNAATAAVNAQGLVTGAAEGATVIRASAGSIIATVNITVNKDYCTNALTLAVGEVRVLSGPSAVSCLTLAATTGATDYLFVTANATPIPDDLGFYSVNLSQGASPDIVAAYSLAANDPRQVLEREAVSFTDWKEDHIRADERQAARRVFAGGNRPTERTDRFLNQAVAQAVAPAVGDDITFHVPNINAAKLCTTFTDVHATVKAVGRQVIIAQDVTAPSGGFTASDFTAIAQEFDDKIYAADTSWFGAPTDRNADGHITMLYTPEVNRATPSGSTGFTAGFFWGGDLFKKSEYPTSDPCPATNEQELFYLLTPDPTGSINGNTRTTATVRQGTRGVIAHEFQHMINQSVRMFNTAVDSLETPWLNEAMSHFAEEAIGRTIRGFGDEQSLTFDDINPSVILSDDYNAFFRQNLARLRTWMVRPDTASPVSIKARSQLAPRGAGWLLVRYTADRFSGGNPRAFFRKLAVGPQINIANLAARAGTPFDDILSGFLVAAYADDRGVAGLASRNTIPSWNLNDVMTKFNSGSNPLLVAPLPGQIVTQSLSGSGNYFRLTRASASPQTKFQMTATSGSPVSFDGARIYVLRLQ